MKKFEEELNKLTEHVIEAGDMIAVTTDDNGVQQIILLEKSAGTDDSVTSDSDSAA